MPPRATSITNKRSGRGNRYLLDWAVSPATTANYDRGIRLFLEWVIDNDDDAYDGAEFDDLLLDYFHDLHGSGRPKSLAKTAYYGIVAYLPALSSVLLRSKRALRGWSKREEGRSYPPITWELAVAVSVQLVRRGKDRHGIGVLLAFDCFLRISELCNLRREDVADSADMRIAGEHKGMLIRIEKAKTGKMQWVQVLDPAVIILVRRLVSSTNKGERLFPFTPAHFRRWFKSTCTSMGLSDLYVPHSLRHGGATRYFHVLKYSLEDILLRGRWASTPSARRYIQAGVAMLMSVTAPALIVELGRTMITNILLYFNIAFKQSLSQ
jgi:integrase